MEKLVSRVLSGPTLPPRLGDLEVAPEKLYLLGELPRGPAVAIVGTREATREGRRFAGRLAASLCQRGIGHTSSGRLDDGDPALTPALERDQQFLPDAGVPHRLEFGDG